MNLPVIALLGRKDEPTDAVEEYCRYLAAALHSHDIQLKIRRVPWEIRGWSDSLTALRLQATDWRDQLGVGPIHRASVVCTRFLLKNSCMP